MRMHGERGARLWPLLLVVAQILAAGAAAAFTESEDQPVLDPDGSEDNGSAAPAPIPFDAQAFGVAFPERVVLVRGQLDGGDVDYYAVELQAGELLLAGVLGSGERDDSLLGVFLPASGSPDAIDDDSGARFFSRLAVPVPAAGSVRVAVSGFGDAAFAGAHQEATGGLVPYGLVLAVAADPASRQEGDLVPGPQGANDSPATADGLPPGGALVRGTLEANDVDFFSLELEVGDRLTAALFDLAPASLTSPAGERNDAILRLFDPTGAPFPAGSDDDAGPGFLPHASVDVDQAGTWTVALSGFGDDALIGAHEEGPFPYALVVATDRACPNAADVIASIAPPASGNAYALGNLDGGDHYYTDRFDAGRHVLVDLPPALDCAHWILTANNDKGITSLDHLTFTLNQNARIYVGYDTRATSAPDWLTNEFLDTGTTIDIADPDPTQEFRVYTKNFANGNVTLGGNKAPGAAFPGGGNGSNYVVIAQPFVTADILALAGTAAGGSVSVTIAGVLITMPTTFGQSPTDVTEALADAIHANATLQGLGIAGLAHDGSLLVTDPLQSVTIADAGLQQSGTAVPLVPLAWLYVAMGSAFAAGLLRRRHRAP